MPSRSGAAALTLLLCMAPAAAETIDVSATTLLLGRQDPRDGLTYTVVPAYQLISIQASELRLPGVEDARIVLSGWGAEIFGTPRSDTVAADLDVAYLEGKLLRRHVDLRVGRQLMIGGAARSRHFDGLAMTIGIYRGLGVTGYGGVPVVPRFGVGRGDALAGTRLFYRHSANSEIGVSFIHVQDHGRAAWQDLSLDGRWTPHRTLVLSGYAVLSLLEKARRLAEADLAVTWQPLRTLDLGVHYRRTSPDLFIPRSSIFSVFSDQNRDEAGARLFARPLPRLALAGDYFLVSNAEGIGHRGALRATLLAGARWQSTLGVDLRALHMPTNGYLQARLFASWRIIDQVTITVDGDLYWFEKELSQQRLSFTGAASLGYDFAPRWRVVIAGVGDVTPEVEQRFEIMGKLVFNHTIRLREVRP